jgi:hypothetical protein
MTAMLARWHKRVVALALLSSLTGPTAAAAAVTFGPAPPVCSMACAKTASCCCAKRARPHEERREPRRAADPRIGAAAPSCPADCATLNGTSSSPVAGLRTDRPTVVPAASSVTLDDRTLACHDWIASAHLPRGPPR